MKKRILSLLLTLVMVVSLLPLNVIASDLADTGVENVNDAPEANTPEKAVSADVAASGTWGGIDWTLTTDGTLTIEPTNNEITDKKHGNQSKFYERGQVPCGANLAWTAYFQPWTDSGIAVKKLVIEEGVTSIGTFAFMGMSSLTGELVIPSTVSYIGQEAIKSTNLTKITFAEGGTENLTICQGGLNNNPSLQEVVFPADRPEIHLKAWVLNSCDSLEHIFFPANVKSIGGTNNLDYKNFSSSHSAGNHSQLTFYCDKLEAITFGSEEVKNLYFTTWGNPITTIGNKSNYKTPPTVANVGLTYATSVEAAAKYAKSGDTITLRNNTDETFELPAGVALDKNGYTAPNVTVAKPSVAEINGTGYETLAEAIAAAQAGETIKLLADVILAEALVIPADKTITLDLNNHSIKQEKNQTAAYSMIVNNGALTIMGTGTIAYTDLGNGGEYVSNTIVNNGVLTVNGGTIMNNSSATVATNGYPHAIDNNAELIINGGEIKCDTYTAIRVWCTTDDNTSVTITGGTVSGVNAIDMQNVNAKANKGTMTISGGNVGKIRLLAFGADNDEIHVAISGGNFTDGIVVRNYVGASEADLNAVFAISGGTFTYDPTPYLAADSKVTKLADGTYSVEALTVYKVATKAELDAAIAAAQPGEVIRLIADIDYGATQLRIEKAIILDLGSKTLTNSFSHGGIVLKNGASIKNGTIDHKGGVAAIKAWDVVALENLTITVAARPGKTVGGIVIQENAAGIDTIKNVTIKGDGLTNGIETYRCGNATAPVIGSMENVTIDAVGTGMNISAPCGTATNCSIKGDVSGIEIWLMSTYSASLDLVDCDVKGGKQAVYVHDEISSNPDLVNDGTINLTADVATTFASENGALLTKVIARIKEEQINLPVVLTNGAVATVGDTYYKTLQAAINAAQNGETITIIADIDLVWDGTTKIDNKYAAISCVTGKAVTIDLNGHKLTGNSETWSNGTQIFAVFAADEGGSLTLKDSVGNASVKVTGASKMYCLMMAYEAGTKLIVEGGSYSLDNASDSLIYSGGDEIITINGGNFYLGNVGTGSNGSPWLFNASGQNTQNIIVNDGTFNADIIHQFYPFEVMAPKEKALKNNGDGTWTMVDAVAYVEEFEWSSKWYTNYVGYATLEEAIAAAEEARAGTDKRDPTEAEVVVLLKDAELNAALVIEKAITFDCNGYFIVLKSDEVTLTAPEGLNVTTDVENCKVVYRDGVYKLVVFVAEVGGVKYETVQEALAAAQDATVTMLANSTETIITVINGATLDLNGKTLTATYLVSFDGCSVIDSSADRTGLLKVDAKSIMLSKNNAHMPVYSEAEGGYKFFEYRLYTNLTAATTGDRFDAQFKLNLGGLERNQTYLGVTGTDLEFSFKLTWTDAEGKVQEQIIHCANTLIANSYHDTNANGTIKLSFTDILVSGPIEVYVVIASGTGVVCEAEIGTFTKAQ